MKVACATRDLKTAVVLAGAILVAACGEDLSDRNKSFLLQVQAEAAVKAALKDPESVEFRNFTYYVKPGVVCGEYKARNSFGGMNGFRSFYFWRPMIQFEEADPKAFQSSYLACAKAVKREFLSPGQPDEVPAG